VTIRAVRRGEEVSGPGMSRIRGVLKVRHVAGFASG
jgi:hypothetical protein